MASTADQLASVQAAISTIESGGVSSYSIGSRSASKLDLTALYAREEVLLTRLQRESGSGAFSLAKIGRRR